MSASELKQNFEKLNLKTQKAIHVKFNFNLWNTICMQYSVWTFQIKKMIAGTSATPLHTLASNKFCHFLKLKMWQPMPTLSWRASTQDFNFSLKLFFHSLHQWFPTRGTCTLRGTSGVTRGYMEIHWFDNIYIHIFVNTQVGLQMVVKTCLRLPPTWINRLQKD